jgi:hypothetical protein
MTGRRYNRLTFDDIVSKTTDADVARLSKIYYDKAMIANLKANTSFAHWSWDMCACGKEATKTEGLPDKSIPLCDGCFFRATVMKAAGRFQEFCDAQEELWAKQDEPIDILKRRPLPARSGKTIQMYNYLGKSRAKK